MVSRTLRMASVICLFSAMHVSHVSGQILPSTNDLWDISQGSVVTASSPIYWASDARNMFGGNFSTVEAGRTAFADDEPPGFVHYIEWQTPGPVNVSSFNLFAVGDGPIYDNEREFAQFVLKAKSSAAATNYDLTLYTLVVSNHPYVLLDPVNFCLVSTNITPVTAQYFRAEFTQYNAGRGYDGPRIVELDGFGPNPPIVVSGPTNETVNAGQSATFSASITGSAPLTYQWQENSTNIPASVNPTAANATLVLNNVQLGQSGYTYSVLVSNAEGSTNTSSATLTVNLGPPPPRVILPSTNDLWDISQGSVVTATSPIYYASDPRNMFGGNFSTVEAGRTVFSDDEPPGFVHYTEWQTPGPVNISSFALFAAGDGAIYDNEREFAQFVLKAKSSAAATNYDLTLYTLVVTNHPYVLLDPVNLCYVMTNITPVTAQYFRAEFTQYNAGRGYDGPRIIELDGFGTNPPLVVSGPANVTTLAGANPSFSVSVTGTAPLAYQWQENSTNMPASVNATATNATLVLTNVQPLQSGYTYSVLVTNADGSANSSNAVLTMLSPGSCLPPPSGMVSWWPGENSGIDIAGTNNGALVGSVAFASGEVGQAFSLDGASEYLDVPDSASLDPTASVTCEAWINPSFFPYNAPIIKKAGEGLGQQDGYALETGGSNGVLFGVFANGQWWIAQYAPVPLNQWSHVAGVYDGTNVLVYRNGVLMASSPAGPGGIMSSGNDLQIGHDPSNPSRYFGGLIDEPTVYNTALSAGQIQAIYLAGSAGKCKEPVIACQPRSSVGLWGSNVVLSVNAVGSGSLGYQWDFNGTAIAGATNAMLDLGDLQFTNAGAYTVVITDGYGTTTSAPANLTVNPAGVSISLYPGITIVGVPGQTYGIQYSTNLSVGDGWLGLANVTLTSTNDLYFDPEPAMKPRRSYRVVPGPISIP